MDDYEMEESVEDLDRLSELPQSLIHHILSFLRMRDVVSTTLLSKRWENLWTTIPSLNFSRISNDSDLDNHVVRNFVNRALMLWKGNKLLKFKICIDEEFNESLAVDMNLWVRLAVENRVEDLNISLLCRDMESKEEINSTKDIYRLSRCLYSCSSIRKLSLVRCNLQIHGSLAWSQLKNLRVDGFYLSESLINWILLGTPQLEVFDLHLIEDNVNLNIQSTSLKKLKINKNLYFYDEQLSLDSMLRICCPNLETLELLGAFCRKCLLTNVSSLTGATLGFEDQVTCDTREIELLGETLGHILSTFQHVERLTLSSSSFEVLRPSLKKNSFPPLPNVVLLEVGISLIKPVEMAHLLEIFPKLKTLVIIDHTPYLCRDVNVENNLAFETNLSKYFLLQLKILEITSNFSNPSIFRCIEFLLKHGSMLEKLVIWTRETIPRSEARLLEVAETLLSMPRSSPTAKVILKR